MASVLGWYLFAPDWGNQIDPGTAKAATERAAAELRLAQYEAAEKKLDETVWAPEFVAQDCARTVEDLWDAILASTNKLKVVAEFAPGEVTIPDWSQTGHLPHGIEITSPSLPFKTIRQADWRGFISTFQSQGWELAQTEFRHNRFDPPTNTEPARSVFYFRADLIHAQPEVRATMEGNLKIQWGSKPVGSNRWSIRSVDATGLVLKMRQGPTPFQLTMSVELRTKNKSGTVVPLIVYDLDGDGIPEIMLVGANVLFRRNRTGGYDPEPLCHSPVPEIGSAVVADFDGDGFADLLGAARGGLYLFRGSGHGAFESDPELVWKAAPPLDNPMVMTCADIDGDGDLDVFLGQYKVPTLGQVVRPSLSDALDSHPAYLLLNDGHGLFTDHTVASGLAPKRHRRVYSASFIDFNSSGRPDLVVVSDFAGMDLYRNAGNGTFRDTTAEQLPERHGFGMSLLAADFNLDGHLDLLMTSMNSPTVERLDHLGLHRPGESSDWALRSKLVGGNRFYYGGSDGLFRDAGQLGESISQSGWSWGCTALDFDNDGWPDVFITNGYHSQRTVHDYDSEYWVHDIYVDPSIDDATATAYLVKKFNRTKEQGWSYGGYEKKRLFLNQQGRQFAEIGFLMGVGFEQDARPAVSADLDGDGLLDLVLTTAEVWPVARETLRIYRNGLTDRGNWIGFRFNKELQIDSPTGAAVKLRWAGKATTRQVLTGDSNRSQHPNAIHFGLGDVAEIENAEIIWSDGRRQNLGSISANQWHFVHRTKPTYNSK